MKSILLAVFISCTCCCASAQESMMQDISIPFLEKLIAAAKENHPKFRQTEARVNVAKANVTRTKLSYFDFLTMSYIYNPNNSVTIYDQSTNPSNPQTVRNPNLINGYQIGLFVNAGALLQRPALVRIAKEQLNVERFDKQESDMNLETEVKRRYIIYVQLTNHLKLKTKNLSDAEGMMKNIKYKFERGETTFDTYNSALMSHSGYTADRIDAEAALMIARNSLEEIVGTKLENIK
ncbi:MAG: hypothetical protein EOO00_02000 [Chitinophagaceae bacterium]|nr:MAG: hypothetical protein EOO00_02000 [Chitinophagaceae bacterium]